MSQLRPKMNLLTVSSYKIENKLHTFNIQRINVSLLQEKDWSIEMTGPKQDQKKKNPAEKKYRISLFHVWHLGLRRKLSDSSGSPASQSLQPVAHITSFLSKFHSLFAAILDLRGPGISTILGPIVIQTSLSVLHSRISGHL